MAQAQDLKLAAFVREHLPRLRQQLAPLQVIAFGSRVRGDALSTSDLDLILVSPWFTDVPVLRRQAAVLELLGYPAGLELLRYTPSSSDRTRTPSVRSDYTRSSNRPVR